MPYYSHHLGIVCPPASGVPIGGVGSEDLAEYVSLSPLEYYFTLGPVRVVPLNFARFFSSHGCIIPRRTVCVPHISWWQQFGGVVCDLM